MQSHEDVQHANLKELESLAKKITERGESRITAGAPGENPIAEEQVGSLFVRKLPDDPLCLRISIGEAHNISESGYVVFRGSTSDCLDLLKRACAALEVSKLNQSP